jgi:6-pyruvoyltetrahydropterin/6-carboxytetrahydropterin synthase
MRIELLRTFRFEAAHLLPKVPAGHKCRRLHGHSYVVDLRLEGNLDAELGWLVDFAEVKAAAQPVFDRLDHYYLNEVDGLQNPTSELLAHWLFRQLEPRLPLLESVTVRETCTSACTYRRER